MNTTTLQEFKEWVEANRERAHKIVELRVQEKELHQKVEAYIKPIFDKYGFCDESGNELEHWDDLYICKNEGSVKLFYAECDAAHRENGFDLPEGYWPNLVAENERMKAETDLMKAACPFFGLDHIPSRIGHRERFLELLMKACGVSSDEV